MSRFSYFRLLLISVLGALTLSLVSLVCLMRISDMVVEDYRYGYLLYIAKAIEKSNNYQPVSKINVSKTPLPPAPEQSALSILEITEFGQPDEDQEVIVHSRARPSTNKKTIKPSLWLMSKDGKLLSSNNLNPVPLAWNETKRPKKVHGIESLDSFFLLSPRTFIIRLDTTPTTYLISRNERTLFQGPFLWIQGIHTFTTVALAVFLALSISYFYARRKSMEARKILTKLGSGDLKARFETKRFDEFGNLIHDFNRMADEIERLVKRVHDTEKSRSNLLQELGHDLRTPLMSLNTAFETIRYHHDLLTPEERNEMWEMIANDIDYFKDLLEKLTIIATIEGPHYKSTTETIDVSKILASELKGRQMNNTDPLQWIFETPKDENMILGDSHLITRLFKNAFDNASRYARQAVSVEVASNKNQIEVMIKDDGPGLDHEALEAFGKRRERRQRKTKGSHAFSLGLGSVIMKRIAEAHGGSVSISNVISHQGDVSGACLKVVFQRAA